MFDPLATGVIAASVMCAIGIAALATLKGWQGWLELKRFELAGTRHHEGRSPAMERIEIADLKERVRQLESIAACVDL